MLTGRRQALDPGHRRRPRPARGACPSGRSTRSRTPCRTSSTSWARRRATSWSRSASPSPGGCVSTGTYESLALLGREEAVAPLPRDARPAGRDLGARPEPGCRRAGTQRTTHAHGARGSSGVFFLIAFVFRRPTSRRGRSSIVGGVSAYVFLAAAVCILWRGWRRRGGRTPAAAAERFVGRHPAVVESVGRAGGGRPAGGRGPVGLAGPPRRTWWCRCPGRADEARVDLVMARHRAPLGGAVGDAARGRRPGAPGRGAAGGVLRGRRLGARGDEDGGFEHGPARGQGGSARRRRWTATGASSR